MKKTFRKIQYIATDAIVLWDRKCSAGEYESTGASFFHSYFYLIFFLFCLWFLHFELIRDIEAISEVNNSFVFGVLQESM